MMKKTLLATALLSASTAALAEFSGNVTVTTDYVFRGISQTDRDPAMQGSLDYNHESGFYAGLWGSNVSFLEGNSVELDYYAGFGGDLTGGVAYDVGAVYYDYPGGNLGPGEPDPEYYEIYAGLSGDVGPATVTGIIWYSPDYYYETGDAFYYELGAEFGLPADYGLNVHVGYQTIDKAGFFETQEDSYMDWSVGITKSYADLDFSLTYTDTDLSTADCGGDICDDTVVFSIGKSL